MLRIVLTAIFLGGALTLGADLAHAAYDAAQVAHRVVLPVDELA